MKKPDRTLIDQLQKGNYQAFTELFYRYRNSMLHYSNYLLRDADEAENIVQESFIKLWEVRERIDPEKDIKAYLFKIIRNKSVDHFKRKEKEHELQTELRGRGWEKYMLQIQPEETPGISLESIMQLLSPRRRMIISLIIEQDKSHKEVAREMDISVNTVKNQMVQARKYLQHKIDITAFYR